MGYYTEFAGAFKITPIVDPEVALRINLWLRSRHYIRPFPDDLEDQTLFGKTGTNGEYIIPSFSAALLDMQKKNWIPTIAPWAISETEDFFYETKMLLLKKFIHNYNTCPGIIPSLWSDFVLIQDPNLGCSWLRWNESDNAQKMEKWGNILWKIFRAMGYFCEGTIEGTGEDEGDIWYMTADANSFRIGSGKANPTYEKESRTAWEKSETWGKIPQKEIPF